MVYPDEFNSRCSFTVLGTIPFSVDGYCNVDDSMREPESDDFKILTTPELKNEKCFFCEQQISEQSKSGVVVMLNGRTYGCLCKMCAEWNAPELQKQLAINV
jgi:hypothetical protein